MNTNSFLCQNLCCCRKKDNMKLDWMYKGPGGVVDREEYLLGRAIDKSFEQMQQAERASTSSKNTVELGM